MSPNAHLGFCSFRSIGEEDAEVSILRFSLGEGRGAAFLVPGVRDGELGAHLILRVRVGVQHGLQIQAGDVKVALLDGDVGFVVEGLIRELGILADEAVSLFFPP